MRWLLLDELMSGEGVGLNKCILLATPLRTCFFKDFLFELLCKLTAPFSYRHIVQLFFLKALILLLGDKNAISQSKNKLNSEMKVKWWYIYMLKISQKNIIAAVIVCLQNVRRMLKVGKLIKTGTIAAN